MRMRIVFWTTMVAVLLLGNLASSAVPLQLPVQGVLRDNAGLAVAEDVFEMTFAHNESSTVGNVIYDLLPGVQGTSLHTIMNSLTNTPITGDDKVRQGAVGAPTNDSGQASGDLFLSQSGALVVNDNSGWASQHTNNRIATTYTNSISGHTFAGLGGTHQHSGWGILYESAPIINYCTPKVRYGDGNNSTKHPSQNDSPYQSCSNINPLVLPIDTAIYFR